MSHETGRPPIYKGLQARMSRQTSHVTDWHILVALKLGGMKYGQGVRAALEIAAKHMSLDVLEKPTRRKRI